MLQADPIMIVFKEQIQDMIHTVLAPWKNALTVIRKDTYKISKKMEMYDALA